MPDLEDASLYVNRELSWLGFNRRVLEEAMDPAVPVLERLKFLSIVESNLAEFFEVRVARLQQQADSGISLPNPDRIPPREQLRLIGEAARTLVADQYRCWNEGVRPALETAGIRVLPMADLDDVGRAFAESFFEREVGPVLTPFTLDPAHPMPHVPSLALCLGVLLEDEGPERRRRLGIVPVPRVLPRIVRLPGARRDYVTLGDLAADFVGRLYPNRRILGAATFRVTRNANLEVDEEAASDLLQAIEAELRHRRRGDVVRIEISSKAADELRARLQDAFDLLPEDVYVVDGPVTMSRLMQVYGDAADASLKDPPLRPAVLPLPSEPEPLFARLREGDVLLHHPYESFSHVVDFVEAAARDPRVLAIKQTLYRTSSDSPIVRALLRAAEGGKQVVVVVELKARFDEAANIAWARRLEASGVHVVYGLVGLKTHAKATLVVRREADRMRRYAHLGTGNYNSATARVYTDLGLLTAREAVTADVAHVFDFLTSLSKPARMERMLVAPFDMLPRIKGLIEREAEHARAGRPARIVAKMNALADEEVVAALYAASQAGVDVDLLVRGICVLRPGLPGVSDRIRVVSIVDRFLEHSRVYSFENGGAPEVFVGSADWMPRNLRHRVEILFPIEDPALRERIRVEILGTYLADRVKARRILADGTHERLLPAPGEAPVRAQSVLLETASKVAGRLFERAEPPHALDETPLRAPRRRRRKSAPQAPPLG
jgi:polyphosphate kinase